MKRNGRLAWAAMCGVWALVGSAPAVNLYWTNPGEGSWADSANWGGAEPTMADVVYIQNFGTAVCAAASVAGQLMLGEPAGGNGTIRLDDPAASLTISPSVSGTSFYWGRRSTGTVVQTAGRLTVSNATQMGYFDTGLALYELSGGTGVFNGSIAVPQSTGNALIRQSGGLLQCNAGMNINGGGLYELTGGTFRTLSTLQISGGRLVADGPSAVLDLSGAHTYIANGANGVLDLYDGLITNGGNFYVAHQRTGTVNQAGGVVKLQANKFVSLGTYFTGAFGTWNMRGGLLEVNYANAGAITLGSSANSEGTFNLGDAAGSGVLTQGVAGVGLTVGNSGVGYLRGWSDEGDGNRIHLTGALTLRTGQVTADGYGADRALDLSSFSSVINSLDNPLAGTSGWYAVNCGELRLPPLAVTGNNTYYWGEQGDLDLVNAARFAFTGASGSLTGRLVAVDHGSAPSLGALKAISVHAFAVGGMTACDLAIRYDHAAAAIEGLVESDLKLYRWSGSTWQNVTTSVDTGTRTIHANGLTALGSFAVGALVPVRGTLVLIQ
jgi:hypothetical protein